MLPVVILVLFVVIFGGTIDTGTSYVNYIVPGVTLTCIGYGASSTAMIVARDMTTGLFNRFRSLPIGLSSVMVGHVVGSVVRNCISTALVFAVAFALGFRPNADLSEWLAVMGLLLLVITAISWLSAIFGLIVKSVDAASGISFTIMFLPYISSAFVPLHTLPVWLQGFAQNQPFTPRHLTRLADRDFDRNGRSRGYMEFCRSILLVYCCDCFAGVEGSRLTCHEAVNLPPHPFLQFK